MSAAPQDTLRLIPSVDAILHEVAGQPWSQTIPRTLWSETAKTVIGTWRGRLLAGEVNVGNISRESLARDIVEQVRVLSQQSCATHYRKAINATGIILHTGLGRAVLPTSAIETVARELTGYSVLQVDPETGQRSRRDARIEWLLKTLTGCEAATVVNNNAAATMIVLNTIGRGREVIVSRGQLVEIGGSFRLPDVMALSGAKLVEVGTTNKTHARDYERAINENTAAILRVHPSNYRIEGFTAAVPLEMLIEIAHRHNLPLIDDVGAGSPIDYAQLGLPEEPTLPQSVRAGADLVLCSTDKMIGGPQGGLILGRAALIEAIRKNPLARALRVDKITLSLLESTLMLFTDEQQAMREVPTLSLIRRPIGDIDAQARRVADAIAAQSAGMAGGVEVIDGFSQVGSGSLPGLDLPTRLVAIAAPHGNPEQLTRHLRQGSPPVFARIAKGQLLIDPRTILPGEEPVLIEAITNAIQSLKRAAC